MTEKEFDMWMTDPLTKEIFAQLVVQRENINLQLTDSNLVFENKGQLQMARLIGQREGLDLLLEVMYEDIEEINIDVENGSGRSSSDDQSQEG